MCGRYTLTASPEAVQQMFELSQLPTLAPRYNIAPTQPVPIITNDQPDRLTIVQWGLVPSWSKDTSIASKLINARAESIDEKPSFRSAFKYRRCLIPADGFFEWTTNGDKGKKHPEFIYLGDREVFAFAGLWESWNSPHGDTVLTCTIITGEPNDMIRPMHHRMAVILDKSDYATWLSPEAEAGELKALLRPYSPEKMHHYEVSPLVNSGSVDTSEILEPVGAPPEQKGMF